MKILLDECVPWPMHRLLTKHTCTNVQAQGWSGIRNGDLLQRAEGEFDLFITSDQNIRYQQNLAGRVLNNFSWQRGYGAFTVSYSNMESVRRYIARQKEHHQKVSFRDEFIQFLKANGIKYDERFF